MVCYTEKDWLDYAAESIFQYKLHARTHTHTHTHTHSRLKICESACVYM